MSDMEKIFNLIKKYPGKYYTNQIARKIFGQNDMPRGNRTYYILNKLEKANRITREQRSGNTYWR